AQDARDKPQGHLAHYRAGCADSHDPYAAIGPLAMKLLLKTTLACTLAGLYAAPAHAAGVKLEVEIPRIEVAEYHRPYVAVWLQTPDRKTVRDIAVWYDYKMPKEEGKKWLKDLRQWWRVSGRSQRSEERRVGKE